MFTTIAEELWRRRSSGPGPSGECCWGTASEWASWAVEQAMDSELGSEASKEIMAEAEEDVDGGS